MANSTIPAAIDHLVTAARGLPAFAAPVVVCDGWPDQRGNTGIVIGITPDDDTTDNLNMHVELGAQAQMEEYDIPCLAWCYVGGGQEAMKAARDGAFALLDALDTYLRAHRSLDDILRSGTAYISRVSVGQTGNAPEAGEGRSCVLSFTIRCNSRSAA